MTNRQEALLHWAHEHGLTNGSITGHRNDMLSFASFVSENLSLSPKDAVHAFNYWRPFIFRVDYTPVEYTQPKEEMK